MRNIHDSAKDVDLGGSGQGFATTEECKENFLNVCTLVHCSQAKPRNQEEMKELLSGVCTEEDVRQGPSLNALLN